MAREGELWDDRALLDAFDDAISKYKKMHGKKVQLDGNCDVMREEDRKNNLSSVNAGTELDETKNIATIKENDCEDLVNNNKSEIDTSNVLDSQAQEGFSTSRSAEDHKKLLNQYYEIENQRQTILQQLQQFGGYNYEPTAEYYGSDAQWGAGSTSLHNSASAGQQCPSSVAYSCCPFVCSYSSVPSCSLCGMCSNKTCAQSSALAHPGSSVPSIDGVDVVKTAMEAAGKALSSIKINSSANSAVEEKGTSKESEGEIAQVASSRTDLTMVLNAWYSAGFYTGRYLAEQSTAKK